ncbi:MAG: HAD family hydrolase [Candidatus Dadabacteria bacterium]|nr:MAG: HAD family hydrolase [Candidatus Dadabacteria bacterium]
MPAQPVYFDLDGTLVDTFPGLFAAVNWLRVAHGLGEADAAQVRGWIGGGIDALLSGAVPHVDPSRLREPFLEHYVGAPLLSSRPYDGIEALLDALASRPLAIVTNKHAQSVERLIEHLGWGDRFAAIVCPHDNVRKPDPEMVERARETARIDRADGWFVGDSSFDIETGRGARLRTIAVTWGFRTRDELLSCGPDVVVDSPAELLQILTADRIVS